MCYQFCSTFNLPNTPLLSPVSWRVLRDDCSTSCGTGTAQQHISCTLTTRYNTTIVDIKHCEKRISELGPRPSDSVKCYGQCLDAQWKYSEWSEVSLAEIV